MPESMNGTGGEPLRVTPATLARLSAPYPFAVRQVMRYASHLDGRLDVTFPDGEVLRFGSDGPGSQAALLIRDLGFAERLVKDGDLGIADAYVEGQWESPDLAALTQLLAENPDVGVKILRGRPLARFLHRLRKHRRRNTRSGARRNVQAHYDLGNAFYSAWLDGSMTYSAALYGQEGADLATAQRRKYHELARSTGLAPEHDVLEIGCGWGGFAEFAAREIGCRVTALTISEAQHAYASRRIFEAGLAEKVTVKLADYRDQHGAFDRIASIEMFEAVGEEYWPVYFQQINERLRPGGAVGLQVITIREDLFAAYRREPDFVSTYIFPGGMLPTPGILKQLGGEVGLQLKAERTFGRDYATTLAEWAARFRQAWPQIAALGFNERFRRLWTYYLAYCEGGFRAGTIDVCHAVFAKPA